MPTSPSPSTKRLTEKLQEKIADGNYKIGCLIVSQKSKKITLKDGKIQKEEIAVCSRKINLSSIRNDMCHQQKKYMRLRPDTYLDPLSREEVIQQLKTINEFNSFDCNTDTQVLKKRLKMHERTRHLIFWHQDHHIQAILIFLLWCLAFMIQLCLLLTRSTLNQKTP